MYRNKASISDYYRAVLKSFEETVMKSTDEYIRDTETSQILADFMKSKHILAPIEFDTTQKESMRHEKEMRNVPAHMREDSYRYEGDKQFEYETILITIPIVTNSTIKTTKDLTTNTYSMSWSTDDFNWSPDKVTLSVDIKGYGFKYEDQQVMNEVANLKKRVQEWVGWANADIQQGNAMLERELVPLINNRKQKLSQDGDRLSSLSEKMGIPLE
jgi:hypothetical protein